MAIFEGVFVKEAAGFLQRGDRTKFDGVIIYVPLRRVGFLTYLKWLKHVLRV